MLLGLCQRNDSGDDAVQLGKIRGIMCNLIEAATVFTLERSATFPIPTALDSALAFITPGNREEPHAPSLPHTKAGHDRLQRPLHRHSRRDWRIYWICGQWSSAARPASGPCRRISKPGGCKSLEQLPACAATLRSRTVRRECRDCPRLPTNAHVCLQPDRQCLV
jgi:hypothetical protein